MKPEKKNKRIIKVINNYSIKGLTILLILLTASKCGDEKSSIKPVDMGCKQVTFNVRINDDDDDQNGSKDLNDTPVKGEDDLVPLKFSHPTAKTVRIYKIHILGDGIGVLWGKSNKEGKLTPTDDVPVILPVPSTIYFEGVKVSNPTKDVCFEYHYFEDETDLKPLCGGSACATIYAIESVVYKAVAGNPLSNNPNVGRGQRIFSGKRTMADPITHETVSVEVQITPVIKGVEIHFQSFDVDDPSSALAPVDNEGKKQDNRGTPIEGKFGNGKSQTSAITNANGIAVVQFSVTFQPGDNFKAVASCSKGPFKDMKAKQNDRTAARVVDAAGKTILSGGPPSHTKVTSLLTVWRKLNMELNSMMAPGATQNNHSGLIAGVTPLVGSMVEILLDKELEDSDQYEGGLLRAGGADYYVLANRDPFFSNEIITIYLVGAQVAPTVGTAYTIWDDDMPPTAFPPTLVLQPIVPYTLPSYPDISHMSATFHPAYVDPVVLLTINPATAPFKKNIDGVSDARAAVVPFFVNANSNSFWVTHLIGCFQSYENDDLDPDISLPGGRTTPINGPEKDPVEGVTPSNEPNNFSCIFKEIFRESGSNESHVVAHETAHQFGAKHGDGGIMKVQLGGFASTQFTPITLNRIRNTVKP